MTVKRLSVSIPEEQAQFLETNTHFSASSLLQNAIEETQNSIKNNPQLQEAQKEVEILNKRVDRLKENLQNTTEWITKQGLWEKFIQEVPYKL
jgi:peptidoglycan hydrolase CwlO-like protein